ncbi:MAG: mechanosensitive ion channel family protein [Bacteroidota bacterium]
MQEYFDHAIKIGIEYLPKVAGAILLLIVGMLVINQLNKLLRTRMEKRDVDKSLRSFISSIVSIGLKVMLVLSVVGILGVQTASFVAVLASVGVAIGLALSGTLQNFAGGVLILLLRPFMVDDVLEAQGYLGVVHEIQIFNTILKTFDNKTVIIPNGSLSTGPVINYSVEPTRRAEWIIGIGYGDDVEKAKKVVMDMMTGDDRVLDDPAPMIAVNELADSSVNLVARAWCKSEDLFALTWDINERVYKEFDQHGLNIPFPQRDLHVYQHQVNN